MNLTYSLLGALIVFDLGWIASYVLCLVVRNRWVQATITIPVSIGLSLSTSYFVSSVFPESPRPDAYLILNWVFLCIASMLVCLWHFRNQVEPAGAGVTLIAPAPVPDPVPLFAGRFAPLPTDPGAAPAAPAAPPVPARPDVAATRVARREIKAQLLARLTRTAQVDDLQAHLRHFGVVARKMASGRGR